MTRPSQPGLEPAEYKHAIDAAELLSRFRDGESIRVVDSADQERAEAIQAIETELRKRRRHHEDPAPSSSGLAFSPSPPTPARHGLVPVATSSDGTSRGLHAEAAPRSRRAPCRTRPLSRSAACTRRCTSVAWPSRAPRSPRRGTLSRSRSWWDPCSPCSVNFRGRAVSLTLAERGARAESRHQPHRADPAGDGSADTLASRLRRRG